MKNSDKPPYSGKLAWLWAMPNISIGLFILAVGAFLFFYHHQENDQRRTALIEDLLWQEQSIRQYIQNAEDSLVTLSRDMTEKDPRDPVFEKRAKFLLKIYPEVTNIYWLDERRVVAWHADRDAASTTLSSVSEEAFNRARLMNHTAFTPAQGERDGHPWFELQVPLTRNGVFIGVLAARVSLQRLLDGTVPWWYAERYQLSIVDGDGRVLASKLRSGNPNPELSYELAFDPPGYGLVLRANPRKETTADAQKLLEILIVGLSLLVAWSLWALRKHIRHREQAEQALRDEYAFRAAMEDSMATGMRAVDMNGRITYVNPAFCRMVGWSEDELVGRQPPMPYWPMEGAQDAGEMFSAMLRGAAPAEGSERPFRKKDGEWIQVLVQSAPLIDAKGKQKGWMSSITDITERKRTQEALAAAYERFVAVMEEINAAIVVTDAQTHALLYANGYFNRVFGSTAEPEDFCLVAPHYWQQAAGLPSDVATDVFDTEIRIDEHWFQVRGRVFKWVDGRTAHMEVATDITERKHADELSRQHEERLQFTARLVTMGEMASSLAHELNQPLSAIASFAAGCLNRLRNGEQGEEILAAVEKISMQARRAGKIVRNMREFVARRTPDKTFAPLTEILEEAAGFADIEASRRNAEIRLDLEADLPEVCVDRVMIEQVILNLVRNGIEAMSATPQALRLIVVSAQRAADGAVQICVADRGDGLSVEVARQLYTPFFSTKPDGMGMGLNICRSIVEFHRGRLWHEPGPEGGTRFCFTLPEGA